MKKMLIICVLFIVLIAIDLFVTLPLRWKEADDVYIFDDYKEKDIFDAGGFQTYTCLNRYFYDEEGDSFFIKSYGYRLVKDNMDFIKTKLSFIMDQGYSLSQYMKEIEFDINIVTEDDLYRYVDKGNDGFKLYYYDIQSHILYEIRT